MTTGVEVARPSGREVVFSRLIAAPVELVWELWSDPKHLNEWFGPAGYRTTTRDFSFEPGGVWHFTMHAPDGTDNPSVIVFRAIELHSRIVYDNHWDAYDSPLDFSATATFAAEAGGTRLMLHFTFEDEAAMRIAVKRYGVLNGGREALERLAHLAGSVQARSGMQAEA